MTDGIHATPAARRGPRAKPGAVGRGVIGRGVIGRGVIALLVTPVLVLSPLFKSDAAPRTAPSLVAEAPQTPATPFHLTGFRSAQFGMTEDQVRKAIATDFAGAAKDIQRNEHPIEKTSFLELPVKDLLPAGGDARITYIFGYQSHKLIQINIGWGAPAQSKATAATLVEAANQLHTYLLGAGYRPDTIVGNARLPDDSILVFRGADPDNRIAGLVLSGFPIEDKNDAKAGGAAAKPKTDTAPTETKQPALMLSYISDPRNPDIFRLKPGQF